MLVVTVVLRSTLGARTRLVQGAVVSADNGRAVGGSACCTEPVSKAGQLGNSVHALEQLARGGGRWYGSHSTKLYLALCTGGLLRELDLTCGRRRVVYLLESVVLGGQFRGDGQW
jgi:hypothetical protein